jgi:hypothetical protein
VGKPFWGTPGRYLPKNMLLLLVEELGNEYKDLLKGAYCETGDLEPKENRSAIQVSGMKWILIIAGPSPRMRRIVELLFVGFCIENVSLSLSFIVMHQESSTYALYRY